MSDRISTITAILIIIFVALVLFSGVFGYWKYMALKSEVVSPEVQQSQLQNSNSASIESSCLDAAMTQYDINICAGNLQKAADAALNALYQKIAAQLDTDSLNQLIIVEKAWINYRDENCKVPGIFADRGSGASANQALCMEKLTNNRIEDLKNLYRGHVTGI